MQGPPDGHDHGWHAGDDWDDDADPADADEHRGGSPSTAPPPERTWVHPSEVGMVQRGQEDRRRGSRLAVGLVLVGVGLLIAGVAMGFGWDDDGQPSAESSPIDTINPSLVSITVVDGEHHRTATGVLLDDDGRVAVPADAIARATDLRATCADGMPHEVEVLRVDDTADVAVLQVTSRAGRPATVAPSPQLGDEVLVVHAGAGEAEPSAVPASIVDRGSGLLRARAATAERSTTDFATLISSVVGDADPDADGAVFDRRGRFLGMVVTDDHGTTTVVPAAQVTVAVAAAGTAATTTAPAP